MHTDLSKPIESESEIASTAPKMMAPMSIHFDIFTLFPQMFSGPFSESIIKRAQVTKLLTIAAHNIRHYTTSRHHVCDDTPYGGGGGMVMKPEPIFRAVETVLTRPTGWQLNDSLSGADGFHADEMTADELAAPLPDWDPQTSVPLPDDVPVILMTPQGRKLTQEIVLELSQHRRLALICGRYEGVDERVRSQLITDEISMGDYVLSGGELAAMVIVDAVTRTLPGALGFALSAHQDSHSAGLDGLLEGPQYTRPPIFRNESIPDVLVSGHHAKVERWRREQALLRTLQRRPDLLGNVDLSEQDRQLLRRHGWSDPSHANKES